MRRDPITSDGICPELMACLTRSRLTPRYLAAWRADRSLLTAGSPLEMIICTSVKLDLVPFMCYIIMNGLVAAMNVIMKDNLEVMHSMPRSKAHPEQHFSAYQLWRKGLGLTAICEELEKGFGTETVSERTVATWIRGYKSLHPETVDLDAPFEWHRMMEYALPWEASGFLLEMWWWVLENLYPKYGEKPTVRSVRWWWRVHQAAPNLSKHLDVWFLAQRFANRELLHEVLGQPLEMADLEAHLAYKPWQGFPEDQSRGEAYWAALEENRIPKVRQDSLDNIAAATAMGDAKLACLWAEEAPHIAHSILISQHNEMAKKHREIDEQPKKASAGASPKT